MGNVIFRRIRGRVIAIFKESNVVTKLSSETQSKAVLIKHAQAVEKEIGVQAESFKLRKQVGKTLGSELSAISKRIRSRK